MLCDDNERFQSIDINKMITLKVFDGTVHEPDLTHSVLGA